MIKPKIYLDTNCFIDLVTVEHGKYSSSRQEELVKFYKLLIKASQADKINIYTSMITVLECLSINDGDTKFLDDDVKNLFNSILLSGTSGVIPVQPTEFIIIKARNMNWDGIGLKKPLDLLHLASAIEVGCKEFVTTDREDFTQTVKENVFEQYSLKIINTIDECGSLPEEYKKDFSQQIIEFPEDKETGTGS